MTPKQANDTTVDSARLDEMEQYINDLLADPRSGGDAKRVIAQVVTGSDFVPADERSTVALEMYERIVEA